MSKEYELPLRKAEEIVDTLFRTLSQALTDGDRIEIRGFGSFLVKDYEGYLGRDPKTGQEIAAKPKKLPFFKAGKGLKERVNGRTAEE